MRVFYFMIGIYKITSPTGKIYIVQSRNISKRFKEYRNLSCKNQTVLYRSFVKHGVEKHVFEIICECEDSELNEKERYYQDTYSVIGKNGLNCKLTKASDRSGKVSDITRINMSLAMKKRILTPEQTAACTKRLIEMNKRRRGVSKSHETKEKLRNANLGKIFTERQGFAHHNSKTVLCLNTGIFYGSAKLASLAYNLSYASVKNQLSGKNKTNNTNLIYV